MPRGKKKSAEAVNGAAVTKWDAVKQALADLGKDAKPLELLGHIKKKFGLELEKNLISNYKSTLLRGGGKKAGTGKQMGRAAAAPTRDASGIRVEDIKAVKALVDRMGADRVRELAQVLAK